MNKSIERTQNKLVFKSFLETGTVWVEILLTKNNLMQDI